MRARSTLIGVQIAACGAAWCLAIVGVRAQPESPPQTTLAGQVEVVRLVDLAAQRLKIAIDYDAAAVKAAGSVALRAGDDLNDHELWLLVNRVLAARGMTTVRAPGSNTYSVVKLTDAPGLVRSDSAQQSGPLAGFRTVVVRARHRPAKDLVEAINKLIGRPIGGATGSGGSAALLGDGGLIVVSDLATHIDQATELLDLVDVPGPPTVVEEVKVRNITAAAMATLILQIGAKRELVAQEKIPGEVLPGPDTSTVVLIAPASQSSYWKALIADLDRRDTYDTVTYSPKVYPARDVARLAEQAVKLPNDERWKLVIDELTGSLIITATPLQHEQMRSLVDRLDLAPTASRRPMRSFSIRNRPVREIQSILDQLIQTGMLSAEGPTSGTASSNPAGTTPWPPPPNPLPASSGQNGTNTTTPSPPSPGPNPGSGSISRTQTSYLAGASAKPPTSEVSLSADEGTNTLIAMGEPRVLSQIETLIQTLDVRQPQVMLEVLILSLSDSQTLDLGVELEKLGGTSGTRTRVSSLFGLGSRDSAGNRTAGDGLGLTGVVLNPGDFSVVLRALQTLNKGRSLSMPHLLVTNNQQATLDSVLEQPYASTNASNTVTTTSFGGSKPAGTQLTLKPQITGGAGGGEGDHLLLDYSVSLSAFVGTAANSSVPPPRQENKLQSIANLPDGHTVVVGGIELNADGKGTSQVPGLGAIPVLGELFKSRSNNASRSRFYVFIRANILRARGFEDLKYMGEVAASQAGIDDGWPVVEPRVIR